MTESRNLYKAYGYRVTVVVSGTGNIFSIVTLATKVGSGLALVSIAAVVVGMLISCWFGSHADILLLYIFPRRNHYKKYKFQDVDGAEFDSFDPQSTANSVQGDDDHIEQRRTLDAPDANTPLLV